MITLTVNGHSHDIDIEPDTPLLYALRDDLALNGAKFGCGLGQCGACTVLLEGQPVMSCVIPVSVVQRRQITTLEGLGTADAPNALQKAFIEEQAAQCGYCIAGMIMRAQALLNRNPNPSDDDIYRHMQPNLCRCGTHMRIVKAIRRAHSHADSGACTGSDAMNAPSPLQFDRRSALLGGGALIVSFSLMPSAFAQEAPPAPPRLPCPGA